MNSYRLVCLGPGKVIQGLSGLQKTSVCLFLFIVLRRSTITQVSSNEDPCRGIFNDFLIVELAPSQATKNLPVSILILSDCCDWIMTWTFEGF